MKMRSFASLGAVLLFVAGAAAVAQAADDKSDPAPVEDPAPDPDPDDPGPAPENPEPLPDPAEMPKPGDVKVSYVDDLPKPPEVIEAARRAGVVGTICLNAHLQGIGWQGWR